jgi:hypothetical protein
MTTAISQPPITRFCTMRERLDEAVVPHLSQPEQERETVRYGEVRARSIVSGADEHDAGPSMVWEIVSKRTDCLVNPFGIREGLLALDPIGLEINKQCLQLLVVHSDRIF